MRGTRLVEGSAVVVALALLFAYVVGWGRVEAVLARTHPGIYSLALAATVGWVLAWSQTLYALLIAQRGRLRSGRFRLVFFGGMALRGLVPGGSVSGPAVVSYVVATSTPVEAEESFAMAYVAEILYWLGSIALAVVGLLGLLLTGGARPPVSLVAGLGALAVGFAAVLAVGVRNPALVERPVNRLAGAGRATVGRVSDRVRGALDPETIDRRLERFFEALGRLDDDPRHLLPAFGAAVVGWLCHVLALYVTFLALGVAVPPLALFFVVPVGGVARGISILPGGLGSVESSMIGLLVLLTPVGLGTAGVAVMLFRLSTYWFRLGVGALCLLYVGFDDSGIADGPSLETPR
ncbi:MAG: YbhN family protein [Salinigranum sp.]